MTVALFNQPHPEMAIGLHPIPAIHRVDHIARIGEYLYTAGTAQFRETFHAGKYFRLLVRYRAEIFRNEFQFHPVAIDYYPAAAGGLIRRSVSQARSVRVNRHVRSISLAHIAQAILIRKV